LLGAAALAAMGSALPAAAQASPPPQRGGNPPRFLRIKHGDMEVTTLLDGAMGGTNANIQNFFPDSRPEEITPLRARAFAHWLPQSAPCPRRAGHRRNASPDSVQ
jgi:hypothetical protein